MMAQSNLYKRVENVDYLADLVGADVARDLLEVAVVADDLGGLVIREADPLDVSAGTVPVESATPLDASGSVVAVESDSPLDVSGATVPVEHRTDVAAENATALASGESLATELAALGAKRLVGTVVRETSNYTLEVDWLESVGGSVLFTETVAANVTAGTSTDYDLLARSPFAQLRVLDAGTGSGAVTLIAYLR